MHKTTTSFLTAAARVPVRLAAASVLALATLAAAQPDTLRKLANARGVYVGAAVSSTANTRAATDGILAASFNGMVAENAMKFQSLTNQTRGTYNWTTADLLADFAATNGMKLRGHALVWHSQAANWFNNLSGAAASRDTTLRIMKEHIELVATRYKGKIHEWDVVNEAIAQNGGASPNYRSTSSNASYVSQWYNRVGGRDYIDSAFVFTQRVDDAALLFYNDFGGEFMGNKATNVYDLVKDLKDKGIPIHGVGLQCHFNVGNLDTAAMGQNMRRLADLGLMISLTEIDLLVSGGIDSTKLYTQKGNFKALMKLCLSVPACKSYYAWGVNDAQSWRGANGAALLYSGTTRKPAYWGVVEALEEATNLPTSNPSAPWKVVSEGTGPGAATVWWSAPVTDGRSAITGYKAMTWPDTSKSCTTNGTTVCTISGLNSDSTHRFVVRARNGIGSGGMSPPSAKISVPTSLAGAPKAVARSFTVTGAGRAYTFRLAAGTLPEGARLQLTVTDVGGRAVWRRSVPAAGSAATEITWDGATRSGERAAPGLYLVRATAQADGQVLELARPGLLR